MFLEFRKFHRKTSVPESVFLIKLQSLGVFQWILRNFLRTPFLQNTSGRLLLDWKKLKTQKYISTKNIFSLRFLSKKLILLYEFYQSTRAILRSPFPFFGTFLAFLYVLGYFLTSRITWDKSDLLTIPLSTDFTSF